jgi:DNA-packaging protein gp3
MAGGRPTKLNKEIIEKTKLYIRNCEDVEKEVNLPTIEGLAYDLGINKTTVYDWRKGEDELHQEFSYLIEDLLQKQARQLVNKGLSGAYNPTIAKVLLTKHGYREGVEQSGAEGKDLIPETFTEEQKSNLLALLK